MKKMMVILLLAVMLVMAVGAQAQQALTPVEGVLDRAGLPFKASYPDLPATPGVSTTTGLPFTGVFLPVMNVLDNAPSAYPHWGVGKADVIYQAPNAGAGATKLLSLFADQMPEAAGGVRSGRTPFVDIAASWGAAFAYAGSPGNEVPGSVNVPQMVRDVGMKRDVTYFDLLGNNQVSERVKFETAPHNLSVKISAIQQKMKDAGVTVAPRGFLFRDDLPTNGVPAVELLVSHHGEDPKAQSNGPSEATFTYDAASNAYTRTNSSGPYVDRDAPETPILFANVIVLRTPFSYGANYIATNKTSGTGAADIFTGGRYIQGGWFRADQGSRYVFVDDNGEEIALQRGKTFIIVTNEVSKLSYR